MKSAISRRSRENSAGEARNTTRKNPSPARHRIRSRKRKERPWPEEARGRSPRRSCPGAGRLSASRRKPRMARHEVIPSIAFSRSWVTAPVREAHPKRCWCDRSPVSAATSACSIGPVLHSRPSASFLIPASTSSSRSVCRDRHPAGAPSRGQIRLRQRRKGDHRRVGIQRGEGADRAIKGEVRVDFVGEQRKVMFIGEIDKSAACLRRVGGPVGLLGSMTTSARVAGVIRLRT